MHLAGLVADAVGRFSCGCCKNGVVGAEPLFL